MSNRTTDTTTSTIYLSSPLIYSVMHGTIYKYIKAIFRLICRGLELLSSTSLALSARSNGTAMALFAEPINTYSIAYINMRK